MTTRYSIQALQQLSRRGFITAVVLMAILVLPFCLSAKEPELLATMKLAPLAKIADKTSIFSSKISENLTALPHIALIGLSFSKDYHYIDLNKGINVYFYSVDGRSGRRIAWLTYLNKISGLEEDIPQRIKWLHGKKACLRPFRSGMLVSENRAFLNSIKTLPPCNPHNKSLVSLKFNSAEYLKHNRQDFAALCESYLNAEVQRRMTRDLGPVLTGLIMRSVDDLEHVMAQSSETLVTLDIEGDFVRLAITAKPVSGSVFASFVSAQQKITGSPPPLVTGHTLAFRGNVNVTPRLRKSMSGLSEAATILTPFAAGTTAPAGLSALLSKSVTGRFAWYADRKAAIPDVGVKFYDSGQMYLQSTAKLQKTTIKDLYQLLDYTGKKRHCSVYFRPENNRAEFAAGNFLSPVQAARFLKTTSRPDKCPSPVYGELRAPNGVTAVTSSCSFNRKNLNIEFRLFPAFVKYFVPAKDMSGKMQIKLGN